MSIMVNMADAMKKKRYLSQVDSNFCCYKAIVMFKALYLSYLHEEIFSKGKVIFRAKRSSLSDETFNMLKVFFSMWIAS
jgi:lipopolysaccharide/colanic/teichoic acid biosynthesis glycosyltransferase